MEVGGALVESGNRVNGLTVEWHHILERQGNIRWSVPSKSVHVDLVMCVLLLLLLSSVCYASRLCFCVVVI